MLLWANNKSPKIPVDTDPLTNLSEASQTSCIVGKTVIFTGKAKGGTDPYKYKFSFTNPKGEVKVKSDYGKATSVDFTPQSAGTYTYKIEVKDNKGIIEEKIFTINVKSDSLKNNTTVPTTAVVKTNIRITGKASGGTTPHKFKFTFTNPKGEVKVKSDYGKSNYVDFTPQSAGTYTYKVEVMDSKGAVEEKNFTITVNPEPLKNNTTVPSTAIVKKAIRITGKASGGTDPYKFKFTLTTPKGEVKVKSDYGKSNYVDFSPQSTGTYTYKVEVKDNNGTVVSKEFKINVTK